MQHPPDLLIAGGRVYDHDGDIHQPPVRDVLIAGGRIVSVTDPAEDREAKAAARRIEAAGMLVLPGFVNAHYHSYDVLQKGMLVLLMDEPFAALDVQTRAKMQDFLLDVWRASGASVLFVTHPHRRSGGVGGPGGRVYVPAGPDQEHRAVGYAAAARPFSPAAEQLRRHLTGLLQDEVDRAFAEQEALPA